MAKKGVKKSELRQLFEWQLMVVFVLMVFAGSIWFSFKRTIDNNSSYCGIRLTPVVTDRFPGRHCVRLSKAETPEEKRKGLSGISNPSYDVGMLFVFDAPSTRCVWMKDMQFALDIIWLDKNKAITHIEKNVLPGTYPKEFCGDGKGKDQYIVELVAGKADFSIMQLGARLNI